MNVIAPGDDSLDRDGLLPGVGQDDEGSVEAVGRPGEGRSGHFDRADGFKLVAYNIPRGCVAAYYPETNPLVPLSAVADAAGTPTSKSIPVLLLAHVAVHASIPGHA